MFSPDKWFTNPSTGVYGHTIGQSLRLNAADSAHLTFAQGTATDIAKWTVNFWLKRTINLDVSDDYDTVFGVDGPGNTALTFLNGKIYFFANYNVGGSQISLIGNRVFRDPSAWYNFHITFDRANSTAAHRVRIYVNGVEETDWSTDQRSTIASNSSTGWNVSGYTAAINRRSGGVDSRYHNGYLAQFYNIDGAVVAPTEFAETKDGVWVPKAYSGSYGNNGWLLEFKQTGTGTGAANTVGADTSGRDNHWDSSGIAATDVVLDSPTNNFSTMNPLYHSGAQGTLSEGNLKVSTGGFVNTANGYGAVSTFAIPKDKKIYIEVECTDQNGVLWAAGFATQSGLESGPSSTTVGGSNAITIYNRSVMLNGSENDYGSSAGLGGLGVAKMAAGDILGMAIDGATGKVWFSRNGTYFGAPQGHQNGAGATGDPAAGTNEIGTITGGTTEDVFVVLQAHGSTNNLFINFGQDSQNVSSAESDGEGIGTFEYTPPTDYLALCSSNLSDPAIGPGQTTQADDHFNTVLWTGNNSASRGITGVGFAPDWVWTKSRNSASYHHQLHDSVRGASAGALYSSLSNAEDSSYPISSFDSDGFTTSSGSQNGQNTSNTYVGWFWKAGGSAVSNSDGDITSSVSANTDAGFSIISYQGAGSTSTIGHGLGVQPELLLIKNRSITKGWMVLAKPNQTTYLGLEGTYAGQSGYYLSGNTFDSRMTTSLITVDGSTTEVNTSGEDYICYAFASIPGFSKVGSYLASTSLPFVFTGFRPAFILFKNTTSTEAWSMFDSTRDPDNEVEKLLLASSNADEVSGSNDIDFLSSGFKARTTNNPNTNGQTYIYLAIAEAPFKFANAR